jgi:hypothetical protein
VQVLSQERSIHYNGVCVYIYIYIYIYCDMFEVAGLKRVCEATLHDRFQGYEVNSGLPLQGAAYWREHVDGNAQVKNEITCRIVGFLWGSVDDLPRLWA